MINSLISCDASLQWQLGIQDPASPVMEGIIRFHHLLMFVLVSVLLFVFWILVRSLTLFRDSIQSNSKQIVHGTILELIWTIVPAFILILIAIPSFALLYTIDEVIDPGLTLKIVGHQWYWSYEYSDQFTNDFCFDSYLTPEDELQIGELRLLEVDNRVVLPIDTHIRLIITAADVLHCWAIPSFGVKVDACPGRLNQASLFVERIGTFYGQCSEICGANHGFIPIAIDVVTLVDYITWLEQDH